MASSRRSASSRSGRPRPDGGGSLPEILPGLLAQFPCLQGKAGTPLLAVAFSGGLDSTVLLDALAACWPASGLLALHVHHHLQPAADPWPAHCQRFAASRGIACTVLHVQQPPAAGENVEQWARNARYRVLAAAAGQAGAAALLTAHHADDQLATLVMRKARGSGARGLAGILPQRWLADLPVLRPLLTVARARLVEHAHKRRLEWVEDPSNGDLRLQRNAVRQQQMPNIDQQDPGWRERWLQEAGQAQVRAERIDAQADQDLQRCRLPLPACGGAAAGRAAFVDRAPLPGPTVPADSVMALDRRQLQQLSEERCVSALRRWLEHAGARPPSRAQTRELVRQMVAGSSSDAQVAVDDVGVLRHRHRLFALAGAQDLRRRLAAARALAPTAIELGPAGESGAIALPSGLGLLWVGDRRSAAPGTKLTLLHGQHGGLTMVAGGGVTRTLKNLYQEAGIPVWLRPLYPLLVFGGEVVFSAALGPARPSSAALAGPWSAGSIDLATLRWESDATGPLAVLLRLHATGLAAGFERIDAPV